MIAVGAVALPSADAGGVTPGLGVGEAFPDAVGDGDEPAANPVGVGVTPAPDGTMPLGEVAADPDGNTVANGDVVTDGERSLDVGVATGVVPSVLPPKSKNSSAKPAINSRATTAKSTPTRLFIV